MAVLTVRQLAVVDARDIRATFEALTSALANDGPAIFPSAGAPGAVPTRVPQRVAVVVETSGSSARPKRVALGADALLASAAASDSALGGPGQWLLALPAHYIAGVNVLVRSIAAQTEPVMLEPGPFDAAAFIDAARGMDVTARHFTSVVPAQLARLVEAAGGVEAARAVEAAGDVEALAVLRSFDRILVGGQSTPAGLLDRALELGLRVTRTYGSSETSGGCVYDGRPIGQAVVRLIDEEIYLGGPMLAEAYLDAPDRSAASFVHIDGARFYRTGDTGFLADGTLTVTGRLDDVIISGGIKVSLGEIESVVRDSGIPDAVVVRAPDDRWGEVAVVMTAADVDLPGLRTAVTARLGRAAAPDRVVHVDSIPLLSSGKPDRVALGRIAEGLGPQADAFEAP